MPSITISSITATAYTTPDGASPNAATYYPVPGFPLGSQPWFSDPEYTEAKHIIPTVGIGTSRMGGFGSRTVRADLIFVGATTQSAFALYLAALAVFQVKDRFNITIRGTTIQGCKLIRNSAHYIGQMWIGNKSHVVYSFSFEELG